MWDLAHLLVELGGHLVADLVERHAVAARLAGRRANAQNEQVSTQMLVGFRWRLKMK
jgi:hypothetical protein